MTAPTRVNAFSPAIYALLLKGSQQRVEVKLPYRDAIRLRLRLYSLRTIMRKENHQHLGIVMKSKIMLRFADDVELRKNTRTKEHVPINKDVQCTLIVQPADDEFEAALREAGIDPRDGVSLSETIDPATAKLRPEAPLAPASRPAPAGGDALDNFIEDLMRKDK